MTKLSESVVIERPVEEVFLWQPGTVESRQLTEGPLRVGTRIEQVTHFLGRRLEIILEISEHIRNKSATAKWSGPISGQSTYHLEPADGGTRLTISGEVEGHGFFKLAEPVFAAIARRELRTSVDNLKDLLEARVDE
ncbi:MAG: SRPBCC family protein [Acidimicrobiia bacterium]